MYIYPRGDAGKHIQLPPCLHEDGVAISAGMCLPLTDLGNQKKHMDLLEKNAWKKIQEICSQMVVS